MLYAAAFYILCIGLGAFVYWRQRRDVWGTLHWHNFNRGDVIDVTKTGVFRIRGRVLYTTRSAVLVRPL